MYHSIGSNGDTDLMVSSAVLSPSATQPQMLQQYGFPYPFSPIQPWYQWLSSIINPNRVRVVFQTVNVNPHYTMMQNLYGFASVYYGLKRSGFSGNAQDLLNLYLVRGGRQDLTPQTASYQARLASWMRYIMSLYG